MLTGSGLAVTIMHACLRDGVGGSPTAVVEDGTWSDEDRRALPAHLGVSHAVFVAKAAGVLAARFFTSAGELPACGHGTIAALAFAADATPGRPRELTIRTPHRDLVGGATRTDDRASAWFDPGPVVVGEADERQVGRVLQALGVDVDPGAVRMAAVPRPRLLVPVADRQALQTLTPDLARLRNACDLAGLLGCFVHSPPDDEGRLAARMFAPSIGVDEDVANANSTACLAALLAERGRSTIVVDMGDALGTPATLHARTEDGPTGPRVVVGGDVLIARTVPLELP